MWLAGLQLILDTLGQCYHPPGSKRVSRVAGTSCHSVGVTATEWLVFESECKCVWCADIKEAPADYQVGSVAATYVSSINDIA